jgi:hypothetical protein
MNPILKRIKTESGDPCNKPNWMSMPTSDYLISNTFQTPNFFGLNLFLKPSSPISALQMTILQFSLLSLLVCTTLLLLSWKILSIFQPPNPSGNGAKLLFQKL